MNMQFDQVVRIFSPEEEPEEAGIYSWCLSSDRLYADTAVAGLFGLQSERTTRGLPISDYLARLHPADRAGAAKLISDAVKTGLPYRAEYRVLDALGHYRQVIALGRCFRDDAGDPTHYSGIIYPVDLL
ncbi:diguanylate cyclase [Rhizobium deserti]|uniref:Diguanylate cyclase n=1 Tax=Rhizobium deserti TaxID=2547961 RepID=A0A4V3AN77_9HYPH|nr:PAS domain-containing protein [Rhizobium deserti]TDK29919.1 diguanylate cyclase [Rhizobium deserti]